MSAGAWLRVAVCVAGLLACGCAKRFQTSLPPPQAFPVRLPEPPFGIPGFVGSAETDSDGYAPQTVDQVAVASLLRSQRFVDLDRAIAVYQAEFERNFHREYWPLDAMDAFDTPDPALSPLLDRWIAANTDSYAAYAARGVHRIALAWFYRGDLPFAETSPAQQEAFHGLGRLAEDDLRKALLIHPRFVAATRNLLVLARAGEPRGDLLLSSAVAACPDCFQPRLTYFFSLQPQWSGSRARMAAFAEEESRKSRNPRLRLLSGYVAIYDSALKRRDGDLDGALALCDQALALGENWEFLHERAAVKAARKDLRGALADLDRAVELRPQVVWLLRYRATIAESLQEWRKAGSDLLTALRLDPVTTGTEAIPSLVSGLREERERLLRIGRDEEAAEVAGTIAGLDPQGAIAEPGPAAPARMPPPSNLDTGNRAACMLAEAKLLPDRKWDEIVSIWSAYLDQHPSDGEAYFHRAGFYGWLGEEESARADMRKACDLGIARACVAPGGPGQPVGARQAGER